MSVCVEKIKKGRMFAIWQRLRAWCAPPVASALTVWRRLCAWCAPRAFLLTILGIFVWRFALDVIYLKLIGTVFAYEGYVADLQPLRYIVSLLAVVAFAPFVAELNQRDDPSSIVLTLLNYLYFVPMTTYWGCSDSDWRFFVVALTYWALILFWQFHLPMLVLKPLGQRHTRKGIWLLTVFATVLVLYVSGRYTGFRLTLDFINVYDIRAESSGYDMPTLISYALSMMTVVLTFLILYWLRERKYWVVAGLCVVYLFYFSIGAHKSVFLLLFLAMAVWILYREWMLQALPWLLSLLTIPTALEWLLTGGVLFVSLAVRRLIFVPLRLSMTFMRFFNDNPLNLFRYGIMGKMGFDEVYSVGIPRLIGEFNASGSSCNNGLLGDLFANLPVLLGLLLLPMILVICCRLLDMAAHKVSQKVLLPFCMLAANGFINASWSVMLLTHGFLCACVLLYFYPKEDLSQ